ncbi:MAG: peptidyl-alpha-hydroxyglycine alpha-amidating lyase family protein [Chloroflexi bacterium]|nr:peptidyl-alpha-hydroxyglycine alpha-amidating lyase family protein [Chloroflexota bacterium]
MTVELGEGDFRYEALPEWEQLPDGVTLVEVPGVAVDANDTVFVLSRNTEHPVMVFEADGSFLRSWGAGTFSARTHGIWIGPEGDVFCADDGTHTITRWTPEGELEQTLGVPNEPAAAWSGQPFNRPTHAAISPRSGDLFVTDGYGNSCVHRFSPDGKHLLTWGEPGIDAGQFIRPHNLAIDDEGLIYVADRECHRVQVFDEEGHFVTMWSNIHRPDGLTLAADGNIYIGELNGFPGVDTAPGLGHRVSVLNRDGELLARFGHPEEGEGAGHFIAPHGIAVDSRGDIYVGEVSTTIRGRGLDPPREMKSLKKLRRLP